MHVQRDMELDYLISLKQLDYLISLKQHPWTWRNKEAFFLAFYNKLNNL